MTNPTDTSAQVTAYHISQYHEDLGPVMWWLEPLVEAPFVGMPDDSDWPGYHIWWTPLPPRPTFHTLRRYRRPDNA